MATNITTGFDNDGDDSCTTASVAPTANRLQLLSVTSRTGISAEPNQPTATGNGLTWVVVDSIYWDTDSSSRKKTTLFRAMGTSPSSGTITIDFGGQNQTHVEWILDEIPDVITTGSNGADAIIQTATDKDESITAATLTVTLAAFSSKNNATYGSFATDGGAFSHVGDGFTEVAHLDEYQDVATEFRDDNDTTVDLTFVANGELGGIAVEIGIQVIFDNYIEAGYTV